MANELNLPWRAVAFTNPLELAIKDARGLVVAGNLPSKEVADYIVQHCNAKEAGHA